MKTTFINSSVAEYTDSEFSWLQSDVMETGYFALQDGSKTFQVVQRAVPSLGIDITAGKILLPYAKAGISWKLIVESNAVQSFSITPNSSGANRVDAVIVKLNITNEPDVLKTNIASVQVIQGTGTSPLTDLAIQTAIGAGFVFTRLANISVSSSATTILDASITNLLPKVKISKAVNIDANSIVSESANTTANNVVANAGSAIPAFSPVSLIRYSKYTTNNSVNYFELGATITGAYPSDKMNSRAGVYTLRGRDYLFGLESNKLFYVSKVAGSAGAWGAKVLTGISVFGNKNSNFTIGCDESRNVFHVCYNKNAGLSDGKLYYRMLTVPVSGVITVGAEVVAWADVTWKYSDSGYAHLDSEYVAGAYYVVFKNDNGTSYKPTMIANTAFNGTWVTKAGFPTDVDSSFAQSFHGRGCALACTGKNKLSVIWYNRTAVTGAFPSYVAGNCGYKEFNTLTNSWSAKDTIGLGFVDIGSDNSHMEFGNNSIGFIDKRVFVGIQVFDSSLSGNQPYQIWRNESFGVWNQLTSLTLGSNLYNSNVIFGGLASGIRKMYFSGSYMFSGGSSGMTSGMGIKDITDGYGQRNTIREHGTTAPGNYLNVTIMRAVQTGDGVVNAVGSIFKTGIQGYSLWYTKNVYTGTNILTATNFSDPVSVEQFVGINQSAILSGGSGNVTISGNITTTFTTELNKSYYIGSLGITPHEQSGGIYIGIGSGSNSISLNINNKEDLSSQIYSNLVGQNIDYDGIVKYDTNDSSGGSNTPRDVFKPVLSGDTFTAPANSGSSIQVTYRRTQK